MHEQPPPEAPLAPPPQGGAAGGPAEPAPRRLRRPNGPVSAGESLMAFDWGARRVGVAVGNGVTRSGQPITTVSAEGDARFSAIAKLIAEWQPAALVVGVPRHPDGAAHENTARAQRFARQLHGRFGLPVHEVDERYSSAEAAGAGAADLDAASAAILLEQYFFESERS